MSKVQKSIGNGFSIFLLLPLLALIIPSFSYAGITDVVSTDKSFEYLRILFGDIVNVIQGGDGPAAPDHIIGQMSEVLNTGMLVFTGLISGYVFLVGVLNSANEGTVLGKSYNTMWIPMRMVLALSLVLPFQSGYSAMQVAVIWMGGQGIGLANSTWNAALDYMQATGSLYPPAIDPRFDDLADAYLSARVCVHGLNASDRRENLSDKEVVLERPDPAPSLQNPEEVPEFVESGELVQGKAYGNTESLGTILASRAAAAVAGYPAGVPRWYGSNFCGQVFFEFPAVDSTGNSAPAIAQYRKSILEAADALDVSLDIIAKDIVNHATNDALPAPDNDAFRLAVDTYKNAHKAALTTVMSTIAQDRLDSWISGDAKIASSPLGAREAGWLSAGAWYWDIQKINAETNELIKVKPRVMGADSELGKVEDFEIYSSALEDYKNSRMKVNKFGQLSNKLSESAYAETEGVDTDNNAVLEGVKQAISLAMYSPDPITALQNAGHSMITIMELALLSSKAAETALSIPDEMAKRKGGIIGAAASLISYPARLIGEEATKLVLGTSFLLAPLALMLAFYLPATPLILWILGVCGWFVLLIEAVIAAPIWAASHAMPEGDGFVGQRAQAGYMVILSLFLRPTLMLFGLFSSMVLMIVMGKVTLLLFIPFIQSMNSGYLTGIVTLFASLGILVMLLVQLSHRCYGLIHEVPDKVLRYIGGGAENLGESSGEQTNQRHFTSGSAAAVGSITKSKDSRDRKLAEAKKEQQRSIMEGAGGDSPDPQKSARDDFNKNNK